MCQLWYVKCSLWRVKVRKFWHNTYPEINFNISSQKYYQEYLSIYNSFKRICQYQILLLFIVFISVPNSCHSLIVFVAHFRRKLLWVATRNIYLVLACAYTLSCDQVARQFTPDEQSNFMIIQQMIVSDL